MDDPGCQLYLDLTVKEVRIDWQTSSTLNTPVDFQYECDDANPNVLVGVLLRPFCYIGFETPVQCLPHTIDLDYLKKSHPLL
ncbi:hypothetical protein GCM10008013_44330 [Paenibacillus segetis]|uniref:Uncharacterized protein n=1 Tax=Paenibacillus segetis TaxID=1325360 RepID=A0ABQ1YV04_9BACL|nr:hypothetical protein GCM10008013_44330 [Paenibacillus segetis]